MKNKYKLTSNKVYGIYRAIAGDLIFYYAIDSIFFSKVKGMSFSLIAFITTFVSISYIICQYPVIKIVKIIGNSLSVKIGCFCYVIASMMMTFCPSIILVFLGHFFYQLGTSFKNLSETVLLKNNLKYEEKIDDYSNVIGFSKAMYGLITAIASLVAGFLFNINVYLPMYLCIVCSVITFILSLFINDVTEKYRGFILVEHTEENNVKNSLNIKQIFKNKFAILLFFDSLVVMGLVICGFTYCKMLFQDIEITTIAITIIIGICRFFRSFSSIIYPYIYKKIKHYSLFLFTFLVILSFGIISSSILFHNKIVCTIILIVGVIILFTTRDPYQIYIENLIMNGKGINNRRALISLSNISQKIGSMLLGLLCSYILLGYSVSVAYFSMIAVSFIPLIIFSILLFRKAKTT